MPNDGRPGMCPAPPKPTRFGVFLPQLPPSGRYGKFVCVDAFLVGPTPRPVDFVGGGAC